MKKVFVVYWVLVPLFAVSVFTGFGLHIAGQCRYTKIWPFMPWQMPASEQVRCTLQDHPATRKDLPPSAQEGGTRRKAVGGPGLFDCWMVLRRVPHINVRAGNAECFCIYLIMRRIQIAAQFSGTSEALRNAVPFAEAWFSSSSESKCNFRGPANV